MIGNIWNANRSRRHCWLFYLHQRRLDSSPIWREGRYSGMAQSSFNCCKVPVASTLPPSAFHWWRLETAQYESFSSSHLQPRWRLTPGSHSNQSAAQEECYSKRDMVIKEDGWRFPAPFYTIEMQTKRDPPSQKEFWLGPWSHISPTSTSKQKQKCKSHKWHKL